jgi:hypothetical protein
VGGLFPEDGIFGVRVILEFFGSVEQSVGENAGEEGLSASTAERRELRLASRRSARLAR